MIIRLAGYNVDAGLLGSVIDLLHDMEQAAAGSAARDAADCRHILEALSEKVRTDMNIESFTPETISAAYARISRDPKPVTELRKAARLAVSRARKSNENIIFGLGHASVAEHACFNFDVLGISRLASEELQSHRLVSFTEKSQRYISLTEDYVIPPELMGSKWEIVCREAFGGLFAAYDEIFRRLVNSHKASLGHEPAKDELRDLENRAKEDARYLLPLACSTQMGMTMNARNVEYVARDFSDHPLQELRKLGMAIREAVAGLAPSLVKYVSRGKFPRANRYAIEAILGGTLGEFASAITDIPSARLVDATPDGEKKILDALAFSLGREVSAQLSDGSSEEKARIWQEVFRNMGPHDGAMREFEVAHLTFEAEISASCFAQLKRHRMMTLLHRPYRIEERAIIPPSLKAHSLSDVFTNAIRTTTELARRIAVENPLLAPYFLTNAHVKRVRMTANARELYHFARLRCDEHAQWEVRSLADQLMALAKQQWPNVFALAVGKHQFEEAYQTMFAK